MFFTFFSKLYLNMKGVYREVLKVASLCFEVLVVVDWFRVGVASAVVMDTNKNCVAMTALKQP